MEKLSEERITAALAELDGWQLQDGKLYRQFLFRDFQAAFAFMTRCALAAEKADHHPEWFNVWNQVEVWLTTHDADGITQRDVDLAQAMNRAATS